MPTFDDLRFFLAVSRSPTLSGTARELQVTTPAVSKRLAQLEARLGVALLNRTTRRTSLTPEGDLFVRHARTVLENLELLTRELKAGAERPQGLLRVNATFGFGRKHVAPLISSFARAWPGIDVQLQLTVDPPSIAEDAWDVSVMFGAPPDARVIARRLAPNRRLLVASPDYLARRGTPRVPADLAKHDVILIRQGADGYGTWRLHRPARPGDEISLKLDGRLATNDGEIAVAWALAGHGIVMRAEWDVSAHLRAGRLRAVLPDWATPPADIHAVHPARLQGSVRVRAFVEHLALHLGRKADRKIA
ncbi:MAG: LysR family transcriptional regulator [Lautropia sp.]